MNFITLNEDEQKYAEKSIIKILPAAICLYLVLTTFPSYFLSNISLTIQPADLINIEPRKKRIIAIGGILGIFVGAITALIIEKRKDILYSKDDLDLDEVLGLYHL